MTKDRIFFLRDEREGVIWVGVHCRWILIRFIVVVSQIHVRQSSYLFPKFDRKFHVSDNFLWVSDAILGESIMLGVVF